MTPRMSLRAAARENYVRTGKEEGALREVAPLPDPLPKGEMGHAEFAASDEAQSNAKAPDLMTRIRALYEDSAVPVREVARLAGVTERTLYKYVIKQNWKRRYICKARDDAVAAANRGRVWQRAEGHAPVKGAGGRFIARADAGKPVVHGIKALDPEGRARANAACAAASQRHAKAKAKADFAQIWDARRRAIDSVSAAMAAYNRWRQARDKRHAKRFSKGWPTDAERAADARMEALYFIQIEMALACVKSRLD